jgi:hypothetical protein
LVEQTSSQSGVPAAALYQVLARLDAANVSVEKIPEQFSLFVDRYMQLKHERDRHESDESDPETGFIYKRAHAAFDAGNPERALRLLSDRREEVRRNRLKRSAKEAEILMEESNIYRLNFDFDAGIVQLREACELLGKNDHRWIICRWKIADAYFQKAIAFGDRASFDRALKEIKSLRSTRVVKKIFVLNFRSEVNEFIVQANILEHEGRYDELPVLIDSLERENTGSFQADLLEQSLTVGEHHPSRPPST